MLLPLFDIELYLLMYAGNTGTHLERNASTTYLYVSHDGGIVWKQSLDNGYGYYQVLDYGVYTLFVTKQLLGPARIL